MHRALRVFAKTHTKSQPNNPTDIYLFNTNSGNIKTTCEICSKLYFVSLKQILRVALAFLLTLNK